MGEESAEKPPEPDLRKYLLDPLGKQSPERLEMVATYATELAEWKRQQRHRELERRRAEEAVDDDGLKELVEQGISTDPEDYEDVPASGAYITVKTTKETSQRSYSYYYWQWREGDAWKNKYIAPVNPES